MTKTYSGTEYLPFKQNKESLAMLCLLTTEFKYLRKEMAMTYVLSLKECFLK